MNELIRALKDFIVRDIIYIIGGVSVVLSILYAFGKMDVIGKEPSIVIVLYMAGVGYVLGWVIQETFCLIHAVTTSMSYRPKWCVIKLLYRSYMRQEYNKAEQFDQFEYSIKINEEASPKNIAESERITSHMLICTTIGPCAFVTGIILGVDCVMLGICLILLSIILMLLARLKIIELVEFTYKLHDYLTKDRK
jgi:hypothetical protein